MAIHLDQPTASPTANLRQWWSVIASLLVFIIFSQAVFAGAMLSGFDWARAAHAANAMIVVAATVTASLVAVVTLRRIQNGVKFALLLLALAAVVCVQFALGRLAAKGANVMWAHVPLGVALVALAGQSARGARTLGEEP
jgi:hypothetical protein